MCSPPSRRAGGIFVLVLTAALAGGAARARPAAPPWLAAVAARPASLAYGAAKAAVLLDEGVIDVDAAGIFTTRTRWAVRILTTDGKAQAVAQVAYDTSSDRVKAFEAWLVRPSGEVVPFKKRTAIDVAIYASARELYGEAHRKIISATDEAEVGDVFAYESVVEENSVLAQTTWSFQASLPVEYSGLTVTLPPGWRVAAHTFNHEALAPICRDRSSTWELRGLPAAKREPQSPPENAYQPWLGLDIQPPPGARTRRVAFASWPDISAFFSPKYDAAANPDAAIKARADALVAGAGTTWDRIRLLCRYAQAVNYIAINLNAAEAGGMIPRPASRVFPCNYGDCKDKATLLRALLRTQGIDSFPLLVCAGEQGYIMADWPAPSQFNHCILAIRVDPAPDVAAALALPKYGSFVLFDPTDSSTPPGWLPKEDCDGRGLLLAGPVGDLIPTVPSRPEQNRLERDIAAQLYPDGSIHGVVQERFQGQPASEAREEFRQVSSSDLERSVSRWLGRTMSAARIQHLDPKDEFDQGQFSMKTDFAALGYGKPMRDTLLVFKPVIVSRRSGSAFKKEIRQSPVRIQPSCFAERSTIDYPPAFQIDELPKPVVLHASFGDYRARVEVAGEHELRVERSLDLTTATVPAGEYETVRSFYEKILEAEQSPVVLRHKPADKAP